MDTIDNLKKRARTATIFAAITSTGDIVGWGYDRAFARREGKKSGKPFRVVQVKQGRKLKKNPTPRKKPRTPAQRAATARMLAANRARRKEKASVRKARPLRSLSRNGTVKLNPKRRNKRTLKTSAAKYVPLLYKVRARGVLIASFKDSAKAKEYGQAYANAHNCPVSIDNK